MGCLASKPATDEEKQMICKVMAKDMMFICSKDAVADPSQIKIAVPPALKSIKDTSAQIKAAAAEAGAMWKKVKNVAHAECRAGSWNEAADALISKLNELGVQPGHIISIDAHNNDPDSDAIFSAHYCLDLPPRAGSIKYEGLNDSFSWSDFYSQIGEKTANLVTNPEDVLAITGSCNCDGRAVYYVFYTEGPKTSPLSLEYVEERAGGWDSAADAVLATLAAKGVKPGQVLRIDAHNNGNDEAAIFSAHYSLELPSRAGTIKYKAQNAEYSWDEFYQAASQQISDLDISRRNIVDVTGSCNSDGRSVLYLFYNEPPLLAQASQAVQGAMGGGGEGGGGLMGMFGKVMDAGLSAVDQVLDKGAEAGGAVAALGLKQIADGLDKVVEQVETPMTSIGQDLVTAKKTEIQKALETYFKDPNLQVPNATELCLGKDPRAISKGLFTEEAKGNIVTIIKPVVEGPMGKHKAMEGWKNCSTQYNDICGKLEGLLKQCELPASKIVPAKIEFNMEAYICEQTVNDLTRIMGDAEEKHRESPANLGEHADLFEKVFKKNKGEDDFLTMDDYKFIKEKTETK